MTMWSMIAKGALLHLYHNREGYIQGIKDMQAALSKQYAERDTTLDDKPPKAKSRAIFIDAALEMAHNIRNRRMAVAADESYVQSEENENAPASYSMEGLAFMESLESIPLDEASRNQIIEDVYELEDTHEDFYERVAEGYGNQFGQEIDSQADRNRLMVVNGDFDKYDYLAEEAISDMQEKEQIVADRYINQEVRQGQAERLDDFADTINTGRPIVNPDIGEPVSVSDLEDDNPFDISQEIPLSEEEQLRRGEELAMQEAMDNGRTYEVEDLDPDLPTGVSYEAYAKRMDEYEARALRKNGKDTDGNPFDISTQFPTDDDYVHEMEQLRNLIEVDKVVNEYPDVVPIEDVSFVEGPNENYPDWAKHHRASDNDVSYDGNSKFVMDKLLYQTLQRGERNFDNASDDMKSEEMEILRASYTENAVLGIMSVAKENGVINNVYEARALRENWKDANGNPFDVSTQFPTGDDYVRLFGEEKAKAIFDLERENGDTFENTMSDMFAEAQYMSHDNHTTELEKGNMSVSLLDPSIPLDTYKVQDDDEFMFSYFDRDFDNGRTLTQSIEFATDSMIVHPTQDEMVDSIVAKTESNGPTRPFIQKDIDNVRNVYDRVANGESLNEGESQLLSQIEVALHEQGKTDQLGHDGDTYINHTNAIKQVVSRNGRIPLSTKEEDVINNFVLNGEAEKGFTYYNRMTESSSRNPDNIRDRMLTETPGVSSDMSKEDFEKVHQGYVEYAVYDVMNGANATGDVLTLNQAIQLRNDWKDADGNPFNTATTTPTGADFVRLVGNERAENMFKEAKGELSAASDAVNVEEFFGNYATQAYTDYQNFMRHDSVAAPIIDPHVRKEVFGGVKNMNDNMNLPVRDELQNKPHNWTIYTDKPIRDYEPGEQFSSRITSRRPFIMSNKDAHGIVNQHIMPGDGVDAKFVNKPARTASQMTNTEIKQQQAKQLVPDTQHELEDDGPEL